MASKESTRQQRDDSDPDVTIIESPAAHLKTQKRKPFDGITDPVVGGLYLGFWRSRSAKYQTGWYPVVVLPTGDFEPVGMRGKIADTDLVKHIPVCYKSEKKSILGWAGGYEDGGPFITKRKFPVMWFEDGQVFPPGEKLDIPFGNYFAWLSASLFRPFALFGPDARAVGGYDSAESFSERLAAIRSGHVLNGGTSVQSNDGDGAFP
jgi:hypothetical protein